MKKKLIVLMLIICLTFQPVIHTEATEPVVTITSASMTTNSASVSGTTSALAVMVRITDESGTIVVMQSFAVSESGTYSAVIRGVSFATGTYTVAVADYAGGEWATAEATVSAPAYDPYDSYTPANPTSTPTPAPSPVPTATPTPTPAFNEIITNEDSDTVNAVFEAGVIGDAPAEMSVIPDPKDEAGAALLDAVLSDEQKASVNIEPVEIILTVSSTNLSSSEEKACKESVGKLESMLSDSEVSDKKIEVPEELQTIFSGELSAPAGEAGKPEKPEIKIAKTYDFTISMKVGKNAPVKIHDLGSAKMTVNFRIDAKLRNSDPLIRRIFFMIHLMESGRTEVLPVNVNTGTMKATVEFSSGSPFILAYTDVAKYTEAGTTLKSSKYNAKYRIIRGGDVNGKVGVLEYIAPLTKKETHNIHSKVTISGITYKVTSIAANAFKGHKTLKKITIGKYITSIGDKAFYKAAALEDVIIKSKKLKSANIGKSVWTKAGSAGDGITFSVPSSKLKSYKKLFGKIGTIK